MRKFLFNASVLGAVFGGFSALRATFRGPRNWRLILVWLGWGISVALAVTEVIAEAREDEADAELFDF